MCKTIEEYIERIRELEEEKDNLNEKIRDLTERKEDLEDMQQKIPFLKLNLGKYFKRTDNFFSFFKEINEEGCIILFIDTDEEFPHIGKGLYSLSLMQLHIEESTEISVEEFIERYNETIKRIKSFI